MSKPTVSVLVTTFNREHLVGATLDAILAQQVDFDFEIVVGDDASTDRTRQVLEHYQQRFPTCIRLRLADTNEGVCANFAKTHDLCQGQYIAVCNSDDQWLDPYKLAKQVAFLDRNPDYNWVSTHCVWFSQERIVGFNGHLDQHLDTQATLAAIYQSMQCTVHAKKNPEDGFAFLSFPHISTWVFRNQLRFYDAWYTYPHHYPDDYIIALMLSVQGKRYDDMLHTSTKIGFQADGWSSQHLPHPTRPKQYTTYLEALLTVLEDVKQVLDPSYHASINATKQRFVLIFFKAIRRNICHLKLHHWPYLMRLTPYLGDYVDQHYAQTSRWRNVLNQGLIRIGRARARHAPPLFSNKALKAKY